MEWLVFVFIVVAIFVAIICLSAVTDKNITTNVTEPKYTLDKWLKENDCHPTVDFSYDNPIGDRSTRFLVDEQTKAIMISPMNYIPIVIPFIKIIGCEIRENNTVTGGIGRAVIGGLIAGGAGAIVGATTAKKYVDSYDIVIFTNDIKEPQSVIRLINYKETTNSINYINAVNFANRVSATIKAILANTTVT